MDAGGDADVSGSGGGQGAVTVVGWGQEVSAIVCALASLGDALCGFPLALLKTRLDVIETGTEAGTAPFVISDRWTVARDVMAP